MRKTMGVIFTVSLILFPGASATADHTDPTEPLAPTVALPAAGFVTRGVGTWEHITNFSGNPASGETLTGGGTDLEFFATASGIFATAGTLGQGPEGHIGQRIIQLTEGDVVNPQWAFDHGSAACETNNPGGVTGLQHDAQVTRFSRSKVIIDTTDATGRCHDSGALGGGLELIDVSAVERGDPPREIHLIRHAGFSHTVTVDATRPWLVYNSTSDFSGRPWIDVLDIRTCLPKRKVPLEQKRAECRPVVYRIPFEPDWSRQRNWYDDQLRPGSEAACHDITARPNRIYCAALNATLIFDVKNVVDKATGNVRGTPLACTVIDGTDTGAKVTDCSGAGPGSPRLEGWRFLGTFNHPGRDCSPPPVNNTSCNTNLFVPPSEGVSVSHEADPTGDNKHMFVTDERGGGVVPPGSTCAPGIDNPVGNGGAHVFDIRNPANIQYALTPDGDKAVFISPAIVPAETFCDIHVMEFLPGEQRFVTAYYTQGTKIVDYHVDANGRVTFEEVAGVVFPEANTWAVEDFKTVDNGDGTVTYFFMATDIARGIDVFKWTGPKGPAVGSVSTAPSASQSDLGNLAILAVGLAALPAAGLARRRRRRGTEEAAAA